MTGETSARRSWGGLALAAYFVLLPAAGTAGALALAPMQAAAGVAGAPYRKLWPLRLDPAVWLFCAFIAWVALSALWSPYDDHTQALKLLGGGACGLALVAGARADDHRRRLFSTTAAAAAIVLAAMLTFEALSNMTLLRLAEPNSEDDALLARTLGRGGTLLVCIVWGAAAALLRGGTLQKLAAGALFAVTAFIGLQFDMSANIIALAAGLIAAAFAFVAPQLALLLLSFGLATWLLLAPWLIAALQDREMSAGLPDSWAMREAIWRYVADQVQARPWFGWGLDGPRTFTEILETRGISFRGLSLHPHSASLQIWLETGLVGALLAAGALALGGVKIARAFAHDRLAAAAAAGALASFGLFANVSYGAWQEWWVATGFTAAALAAAVLRPQSIRS